MGAKIQALAGLVDKFLGIFQDLSEQVKAEKIASDIKPREEAFEKNYEAMRQIIVDSPDFNDKEKLIALQSLNDVIGDRQKQIDDQLMERQNNAADVIIKVLSGFLTLGVSLAPDIIKKIKGLDLLDDDQRQLVTDFISNHSTNEEEIIDGDFKEL